MSVVVVFILCSIILECDAQRGRFCKTPNGESASCISIYDCPVLFSVVTTKNAVQKRFLSTSQCGYDTSPLVCCGTQNNYRSTLTTETPFVGGNGNIQTRTTNSLIPDRSACGFQLSDKIYSGNLTGLDEFPWMALLQYSNNSGFRRFSCGGSLISSRYVLTAAHCVTGRILKVVGRLVNVRLGEWSTDQDVDCVPQYSGINICNDPPLNFGVENTIFHSGYSDSNTDRYNDIALVRLDREVTYTDFIRPICLPQQSDESRVGEKLIVAGWGRTEKSTSSPVKLKVQVPFADKSQCSSKFRSANIRLGSSQICAGGEPLKDSCTGDSGGPLMTYTKNDSSQWYIEGIVSFGAACGTPGWPGVYTKVADYVNWINENVRA